MSVINCFYETRVSVYTIELDEGQKEVTMVPSVVLLFVVMGRICVLHESSPFHPTLIMCISITIKYLIMV